MRAFSVGGTGLVAESNNGAAVSARGAPGLRPAVVQGGLADLRFDAVDERQAPSADTTAHLVGEVLADGTGTLWQCITAGTPGTWRKLGGVGTAGQLHILPAPKRVYDSRPGTSPAVGPKTPFTPNSTRTFDLKANSSGVPAGATAALLTVLLVNASTVAGNLTVWANGVPKPQANTVVWGGTAGRFTATAVSALDSQVRVQVNASQSTNLVLDVVGYYL